MQTNVCLFTVDTSPTVYIDTYSLVSVHRFVGLISAISLLHRPHQWCLKRCAAILHCLPKSNHQCTSVCLLGENVTTLY